MSNLRAFVGHSFVESDKDVVREFLDFFNGVEKMDIGFTWEHAEAAAPKILSEKVMQLMENKNLFIAICTAKEYVIAPDDLKQTIFSKNTLKAKKDACKWKTSDWIIQEIGVAVGKKMDIVVLLEEGLREPGGLQGDLEYIPFIRDEPSKSYKKIIEMLTALSPKETLIKTSPLEPTEKNEVKAIPQNKDEKKEPTTDWQKKDYLYALFRAIAEDNKDREEKIIESFNNSEWGQKDSDKASFEALKYYYRGMQKKGVYLEELKQLSDSNPDNSHIYNYLGNAYKEYKNNDKAAIQYEKAAEYAQSPKEKLARFCDAAAAKSEDGFEDSEYWLINKVYDLIADVEDGEFRLFATLKNIFKIEKKNDKYFAYAERLLDIKPDDHGLRFELAYKYSKLKNNEFALFHYMLIPKTDITSTTWNNIGVANERLGINGEAIKAYRKSEKLNGTLAMSNLAHKFIEVGFLEEADEICSRAVKIENYDKQVGTAITSIKVTIEKEEEDQKTILDNTEQKRRFYIDFGRACIKQPISDYKGLWTGPECELNVELKEKSFIAKGSYEKTEFPGLGALYARHPISTEKKIVKMNVLYEGIVTGHGIEYKLYIEEEGKRSLLSATPSSSPSKEGLMVIADDRKKIRVYEKGTKETDKFYKLQEK